MKLLNKLKLDKHHSIERFGVTFLVLSMLLTGTLVSGAYSHFQKNKDILSSKVIYTEDFSTSRTNVGGSVKNIYTSSDGSKVFVLLKFKDTSAISIDPNNYKCFLTGSNSKQSQTPLESKPTIGIYSFGTTGYVGLYLINSKPFPSQILDLVVRANTEISGRDSSGEIVEEQGFEKKGVEKETQEATPEEETSFTKYDQFRLYLNPGGKFRTVSKVLDDDAVDAHTLYQNLVSKEEEKTIKKKLEKQTEMLDFKLKAINEYAMRFNVDTVNGQKMLLPDNVSKILEDRVEEREDGENVIRTFKPKYMLPGGFEFNWQDRTINSGYLNQINPDKLTYADFIKKKHTEESSVNNYDFTEFPAWRLEDGSNWEDITRASNANNQEVAKVNVNINNLTTAVNDYIQFKKKYQIDLMRELLDLEDTLNTIDKGTLINDLNDTTYY